jgi:acyl-CoA dehydrogenase
MDFALDDEQSLLVTTVRRWSERTLRGWAADADRRGAAPDPLWDAAAELGLLVDAVPAEAGGLDEGSYSHLARALRGIELGRGCAALAALCESNVEPALAAARWGSESARGALFGALSGGGTAVFAHDFHERLTIEEKAGGRVAVSGRIGPLPGLARASHLLVAGGDGMLLLVPVSGAVACDPPPSGWRAAAWGTLTFDGEVPAEQVLARGGDGAAATAEVLSWYRAGLAARAVGVAAAAIEHAVAYGEERIQFGRPIGRFQSLAHMRDENQTAIAAARATWPVACSPARPSMRCRSSAAMASSTTSRSRS